MTDKKDSRFRVTSVGAHGRTVSLMTKTELQRFRAKRLKSIREVELGLTQKDFARTVGANLRTLQDWEMGRSPMPKAVEILIDLMKEMPSVKKRLLSYAHA